MAFPVNVRFGRRSRGEAEGCCGDGFGGGSEGIAATGRMVVTRTGHCQPPWLSSTRLPLLPHAKSPFVALDGKLLFVRRLRGEFSDDETDHFERDAAPVRDIAGNRSLVLILFSFSLPRLLKQVDYNFFSILLLQDRS